MIVVGLTGGIGSGKSTVAAGFVQRGAVLVDADAIVRDLQQAGQPVFDAMVARFGVAIVGEDGELDRAAVAQRVFADEAARKDLERIVHPAVGVEITRRLHEADRPAQVVVLDIPLLAEGAKGGQPRYPLSGTLVVDVPVPVQVDRLVSYRSMDADAARARIAAQADRHDRLALADRVIDNSGDLDALRAQVGDAWAWAQGLDEVGPPAEPSDADQIL